MDLESFGSQTLSAALGAVLGLVVPALAGYWGYKFFSEAKQRRRIYRRQLGKMLERSPHGSQQRGVNRVFKDKGVRGTLDSPDDDVLAAWLALTRAMANHGVVYAGLSGEELFRRIAEEFANRRTLRAESVSLGEQIRARTSDPRFSGEGRAKEWVRQLNTTNIVDLSAVGAGLPLFEEVNRTEEWKKAEFKVVAAALSLERRVDGSVEAHASWPRNPFVAFNGAQRRCLEGGGQRWPGREAMEEFLSGNTGEMAPVLARFSAGGSLTVLSLPESHGSGRCDYIVVGQKDARASIHANHLIPSSGLSSMEQDWENPLLVVVGECVEEIRVCEKTDGSAARTPKWFLPRFEGRNDAEELNQRVAYEARHHEGHLRTYETDRAWRGLIPGRPHEVVDRLEFEWTKAEILPIGRDLITINNGPFLEKHLLVLDPIYGAVDVMTGIRMEIDRPVDQLRILDGEAILDRAEGCRIPLWRSVYVFTRHQLRDVLSGRDTEAAAFFGRDRNGRWIEKVDFPSQEWPISKHCREGCCAEGTWPLNPPLREAGAALLQFLERVY